MRLPGNRCILTATGGIKGALQIPDHLTQVIVRQVAEGHAASEADYVSESLRAYAEQTEAENEIVAMADRADADITCCLQLPVPRPILPTMKTETKPRRQASSQPRSAPSDTPAHVAVAPGLLDHEHVVVRDEEDTDADYEARRRLLDLALRVARRS
jgi:Arc/MetJ-type ribon-helix-helix transcriptional regulator